MGGGIGVRSVASQRSAYKRNSQLGQLGALNDIHRSTAASRRRIVFDSESVSQSELHSSRRRASSMPVVHSVPVDGRSVSRGRTPVSDQFLLRRGAWFECEILYFR